ncbi:MAG: hypothetical protein IJK02_08815 [Clostridia bacterium]|nr:hypothetical protein [Clostridia bacterium]
MSTENNTVFTRENLDLYLKELAKEYRKLSGKSTPAEIILIGGAAILERYGFRDMTTDVDAIIRAASSMKEAANRVRDRFDLPVGWLNADFMQTDSFTPKLIEHAVYYKTYSNVLNIRIVAAEYLIAMKLKAGRKYKNDLSDIIGILAEHEKRGEPIGMERIETAVIQLYGRWENIPSDSAAFIRDAMHNGNFSAIYEVVRANEQQAREMMVQFQHDYPGVMKQENVEDILNNLQKRENSRAAVLEQLKKQMIDK